MSQVAASGTLIQNNWPVRMGVYSGAALDVSFLGYINEVRIWNKARTQTEIKAYMNTSLPSSAQTGLMAYYVFNNLQNKQGNSSWNGVLTGNAKISQINPSCNNFIPDSCGISICRFQSLNIQDSILACRTVQLSSGAYMNSGLISTFQWSFGDGTVVNNQTVVHNYKMPGTYAVKLLVSSSNGCKDSTEKQVSITSVQADAGNDTVICKNQVIKLQGNSNAIRYAWSPGKYLNDSTLQHPAVSIQNTTRFTLTVKGAEGCTDTSAVLVNVRPIAIFSTVNHYEVCKGETIPLNIQNGDEYSWTPAAYLSNPAIRNPIGTPDKSIQYSAYVKERTCNTDSTILINIVVNQLPVVLAAKSNDIDCVTASSKLDATGALTYLWAPSSGLNDATAKSPVSSTASSTVYTVKGTDINGCSAYDTIDVLVTRTGIATYGLPNAFTPNGDGNNDCFGTAKWSSVTKMDFSVFNRFGQKIYFSRKPTACWNGTYNGVLQDSGEYVYIIKAESSCGVISKKGIVWLLK